MTHASNQTLEEQLAQRLYELDPQGKGSLDIRPWSSLGYMTQQRYQVMAAECLRQMWFSLRAGISQANLAHHFHPNKPVETEPPTLAPNDWIP